MEYELQRLKSYGMAMFFLSEFDEGMTLLDSCRLEPWHCYDV